LKILFRRRASVEAVISHLKHGYGLARNFLKGTAGDAINLMLSAAAFNFNKLLSKLAFIFRSLKYAIFCYFVFL
jgi:IS5 family transposase